MQRTKLNKPAQRKPVTVQAVAAKQNLEIGVSANGNLQFKKEPLQHLYEIVVSTLFGKDTYYQTSDQLVKNMIVEVDQAVKMGALDFVANLAIHARTEMNIRTMPVVLVVQFANSLRKHGKVYPQMRQLVCDVIQRADQINDLYAYALTVFGDKRKVPTAIKRGVADAFNKFGEYHFGKYNRDTSLKFKDVLRIVHPTAKSIDQGQIFDRIMKDQLETPYTWEVELSTNGQKPVAERLTKDQLWTNLINSGKVGYMAQLRNLRNIVEAKVDSAVSTKVAQFIADPVQVAKSKQLPFDFVEAYRIVKPLDTKLATAISKAIDVSCTNIPKLGNNIWIIIDYSGSMGNDTALPITNATLLAAGLIKSSDLVDNLAVTLFGSDAKTLNGVDTNNSVMSIQQELLRHRTGSIAGSTNFRAALSQRSKLGFKPDTIIVLTDGEINDFPYREMHEFSNQHNIVKLAINLNSTPTTPMIQSDGWYSLAGWSSAMFKWIPAIRNKDSVTDTLSGPYKSIR
ncbi:MAG: TROVE domain-containing protein [Hydrotalea sp. AMD]|uniref:TROVE domain-containing protein n=1 Tax=Hydrotalea sp. AMD TaxID=2501297 RepID=UPI001026160C|nr:TROVE domain-containing protein [Hydrotalea sp. AMD]RWZ87240.1 MAG: TROVE domain-containing protein [Hydrotalea sp. AMD]